LLPILVPLLPPHPSLPPPLPPPLPHTTCAAAMQTAASEPTATACATAGGRMCRRARPLLPLLPVLIAAAT